MKNITQNIKDYLNFKITFEESGLLDAIASNDSSCFEQTNYLNYLTAINGFDKFLLNDIDLETFLVWSNLAVRFLEISLENGCVIEKKIFKEWKKLNMEVLGNPSLDENEKTMHIQSFRTYLRYNVKPDNPKRVNQLLKTIEKLETKKSLDKAEVQQYLDCLEELGTLGDPEAINFIGTLYYSGRKVEQDFNKAREYYELASNNGSAQATINLGYIYFYARCGGKPDYEKAYNCFYKAQFIGDRDERIEAQYKLFDMFFNGYYVDKDVSLAFDVLKQLYKECKLIKKDEGKCDMLGDLAIRMAKMYSSEGIKNDPIKRLKYYQEAQKLIQARWDGIWFGDKKLLETCKKEISKCEEEIRKNAN